MNWVNIKLLTTSIFIMKKLKFYIPVIAILCAGIVFSTTSCVDDSESQSVTQLRGAHAEQMKAEATLALARAEAEKIVATATAAVKNAEAKKLEAEAAWKAAETDYDKARWKLELAKLDAEVANAISIAEAELEANKLKLLQAQQKLQEEMAKVQIEDPALKAALLAYQEAIVEINGYTRTMSAKKIGVIKDKKLLVGIKANNKAALDELVVNTNRDIAKLDMDIVDYTKQLKSWEDLFVSIGQV